MPPQVYTDQTHRASEYDWLDGYALSPSVMLTPLLHGPTDMYLVHSESLLFGFCRLVTLTHTSMAMRTDVWCSGIALTHCCHTTDTTDVEKCYAHFELPASICQSRKSESCAL